MLKVGVPRPSLLGMPPAALADALRGARLPAAFAVRLFTHLQKKGQPIATFRAMTASQRARCEAVFAPTGVAIDARHRASDGTERLIFALDDGARVEGVLIPEGPRSTLCVSSQVGCAMGCAFCATATLGLRRGLRAAEIVAQVQLARALCRPAGEHAPLRNVVLMGMGEPLQHYVATRDALAVLTDPGGLALAYDRVTVSTVGLVPAIARLGRDFGGRIALALSLHAGRDATRRRLVPMHARWDLAALRAAVQAYPLPKNRFVLIEYVLLAGVNDGNDELAGLVEWARGLPVVVNFIAWNPFEGGAFRSPSGADVARVVARTRAAGIRATVRLPRGRDEHAACGQLALAAGGSADGVAIAR